MHSSRLPLLAFLTMCPIACSSGNDGQAPKPVPPPEECTSGVCIDVPEGGFAVEAKGTTIEPGEDVQYCEVVEIPGEPGAPVFVSAIDGKMTRFSHHLNAMIVVPGSDADSATKAGDLVACVNNGREPFGSGLRQIFSMGSPEEHVVLPEGMGHRLEGGQKLVLNYHYFNSSEDEVAADAALAFHVTDAANVTREVRRFGMYNVGIQIPASGKASFTSQCTMKEDVQIVSLWRHTHRWGTDFSVWRTGGSGEGEHVFTKTDWEHDIVWTPDDPYVVHAGEGFRFQCDFENTTEHELAFGELATDEMCILYGYFVGTGEGLPGPEDCVIPLDTPGATSQGYACTQCPDGE